MVAFPVGQLDVEGNTFVTKEPIDFSAKSCRAVLVNLLCMISPDRLGKLIIACCPLRPAPYKRKRQERLASKAMVRNTAVDESVGRDRAI